MTPPPCLSLCPAYPGNPRNRIEGESPQLRKGHTLLVALLLGRKCRPPASCYLIEATTLSFRRVGRQAGAELAMTATYPNGTATRAGRRRAYRVHWFGVGSPR